MLFKMDFPWKKTIDLIKSFGNLIIKTFNLKFPMVSEKVYIIWKIFENLGFKILDKKFFGKTRQNFIEKIIFQNDE